MKHVRCCTIVKNAPAIALLQFMDAIKAGPVGATVKDRYIAWLADPDLSISDWLFPQE